MVTLFMTVGTGRPDPRTGRASIAHGLAYSVACHRPGEVVFFGSDQSAATVRGIAEEYQEMTGEVLPPFNSVVLPDVDDLAACIEVMDAAVKGVAGRKAIDYTSGTKSMTAAAVIVAALHQVPLSLVEARRGVDGIGISGTEHLREQRLSPAYTRVLREQVGADALE
ncbi:hypothetical protein E2N92_01520 [Methanofollis formosanus]|uniref:TIGR02710 family CRISPR-associated protein n=1 Tax=Methanofollis formosanus TaxID=299308 RepID=A0A8G0ZYZ0_9EURY|nr:hypothetical protein [Methanofollis formosanus]QYZ78201.1 hypothetical protein E2N92_01520 [Methanofollis formosanus]